MPKDIQMPWRPSFDAFLAKVTETVDDVADEDLERDTLRNVVEHKFVTVHFAAQIKDWLFAVVVIQVLTMAYLVYRFGF